MKAVERDRFLIGFLCALALHVLIVLLLGLVDLEQGRALGSTLPPVTVRLDIPDFSPAEPLEKPAEPEELEALEESLEQPEEPKPPVATDVPPPENQTAVPRETAPQTDRAAPLRPAESRAASQTPSGAPSGTSTRSSGETGTSGEGYTIPQPPAGSSQWTEVEQGPRRRTPSGISSEETPASRSLEGTEEAPVSAEEEGERSESRVVTAERPDTSVDRRDEDERADTEGESILSRERLSELDRIGSTEGQSSEGRSGDDRTGPAEGRTSGDSTTEGPSSGRTTGENVQVQSETESGDVLVSFEEGHQTRRLLDYSLPELSDEQLSRLPGRIEVRVAFSLEPNGVPLEVRLPQGSSTGYPVIDNRIIAAVRSWKFESVSGEGGESVRGEARIVLRSK